MPYKLFAALVLVSCGGNKATVDGATVDGLAPADAGPCDPTSATSCGDGMKCTWIIDQDGVNGGDPIAHIGCAPDGTVDLQGTCTEATSTANGGADDCKSGSYCYGYTCVAFCDT